MIIHLKHRFARRLDAGAVLVFALIIVTGIALVVGTLLTRGSSSLKVEVQLRNVAGSSYAAEAAANIAINDMRTGYGFGANPYESAFNNDPSSLAGCFGNTLTTLGGTDSLLLQNFYPPAGTVPTSTVPTSSAYVECAGERGTGRDGPPVPISAKNKPGFAILTLNGNINSAAALAVHGSVYSNAAIVGPVALDAGDASAYGACTQTTVATGTKTCNTGRTIPDPNNCSVPAQASTCHDFDPDLSTVPQLQTPPTTCSSGVAIFQPGYYDDAAALNTAMTVCSASWFKPGDYYFDFHNNGCTNVCPANLFPTGSSDTWTIPRGETVIGGTPINAAGAVISQPSSSPTLPGSCQSPITSTSAVGVQFIFGSDSHLYLAGGGSQGAQMELCASYHALRPPIEFYGLKTGSTPTSANANGLLASGAPTGTTTAGSGSWSNLTAAALASADGTAATWTTTGNGTKTGTLSVPGFSPAATIPTGSVLTGATLHLTHKEADTNASSATIKVNGASSPTSTIAIPDRTTSTTDNIDLTTNPTVFNALQHQVHDNGYTGATVTIAGTVKTNGNNTETVDAMSLDLTYYVPVLRGEGSTCVDGTGTPCAVIGLDTTGNNKIQMYLQGTTYTPVGDLNFTLSNFSAEVAMFGVIARQVEFNINTGNPSYHGPIFQIPDDSPGYGYQNSAADLKVHFCLNQSTCGAGDPIALTARVQLWDPSGSPIVNQRQVTILSWNHTN